MSIQRLAAYTVNLRHFTTRCLSLALVLILEMLRPVPALLLLRREAYCRRDAIAGRKGTQRGPFRLTAGRGGAERDTRSWNIGL